MSETASGPPPRRAPHPYQPIRALLRAGKNDEAIVRLCAITITRPNDLVAGSCCLTHFSRSGTGEPAPRLLAEQLV